MQRLEWMLWKRWLEVDDGELGVEDGKSCLMVEIVFRDLIDEIFFICYQGDLMDKIHDFMGMEKIINTNFDRLLIIWDKYLK